MHRYLISDGLEFLITRAYTWTLRRCVLTSLQADYPAFIYTFDFSPSHFYRINSSLEVYLIVIFLLSSSGRRNKITVLHRLETNSNDWYAHFAEHILRNQPFYSIFMTHTYTYFFVVLCSTTFWGKTWYWSLIEKKNPDSWVNST